MYRVLLVDDEPRALIGIQKTFKWEQKGFEVIAGVTDSLEAMDIITKEIPDVVFTDIRMPALTGIQLIEKTRELKLDTEFIIVSGYAEFSYARDALRYGAFDYCLKPLDMEEADGLLKKLAEYLDRKVRNKENDFFEKLTDNSENVLAIAKTFGFKGIDGYYQAAVAISAGEMPAGSSPFISGGIDKMELRLGEKKRFYLVNTNKPSGIMFEERLPEGISVGVSSVAATPGDLPGLYREADIAANSGFIHGAGGFYRYTPKNIAAINLLMEKVQHAMDRGEPERLARILESVPGYFRENRLYLEDITYFLNQVTAYIMKNHPQADREYLFDFVTYDEILMDFKGLESLCASLLDGIWQYFGWSGYCQAPADGINDAFKKLLQYIDDHFDERLFLKELTERFFINESYCCSLFRKVTGGTFSDYITKLRMERACTHLKQDILPINEVAQRTGYNDCFYFSKVFKKYYGSTPSKYRNEHRSEIAGER